MGANPNDAEHAANNKATRKPVASMPLPYSDWQIPDRYEVRHLLGTGSYGQVCEAYDKVAKRVVAIKKIQNAFEDLIDCKRILREVAILNRLKDDRIVRLLDILVPTNLSTFDELYLVLEIADSDLKKLFRNPIYLSELHIKTLLYNLLVGVQCVHSAGVYHRDLKPANCLVNQDCTVKICDFGLARTIDTPKDTPLPRSTLEDQEVRGVPHTKNMKRQLTEHVVTRWYRAPELILLQENYTEAIDIWSIGCIFAELLGTMKENVSYYKDRGPLLPGNSCFPLSPDQRGASGSKAYSKANRDQLNVIFNVLGTPADEDIKELEKEDAQKYTRLFYKREPTDLSKRFPGASAEAIRLLKTMLTFNPKKRISIAEALESSFFTDLRNPAMETKAKSKVKLPFDDWLPMDEKQLRYAFLREIQTFHPDVQIPEHLEKVGYVREPNKA